MLRDLLEAARGFSRHKAIESMQARQMAAFRLMTGIDLGQALSAEPRQKAEFARRVERLLERERMRGLSGHWSYDLNRHIALKQACDRLREGDPRSSPSGRKDSPRRAPRRGQARRN